MSRGRVAFERVRRSVRGWWGLGKMHATVSKRRGHFVKTYDRELEEMRETPDGYEVLRSLGSGVAGEVLLVRNLKDTLRRPSALKVVDKAKILGAHLDNELRLLNSAVHPFVAGMKGHFTAGDKVYVEMPYYPGGDLFTLLEERGKRSPQSARFYGAQLVMGIDFLHGVGIIHRDLKPRNVAIDANGYLKIIDFGHSVKSDGEGLTLFCGTYTYMAPEMLSVGLSGRGSYGESVDWWAFGLIMYNVVTGGHPYRSDVNSARIMSGTFVYPTDLDRESKLFLAELLRTKPELRLGCGKAGAREIKRHPWFSGVDWPGLFFRKVKAPWVPEVQSEFMQAPCCRKAPCKTAAARDL